MSSDRPEIGTEDYRRWAVLFNDITRTPTEQFIHFGTRHDIADHLWRQGWRRDVRPEDVNHPDRAARADQHDAEEGEQ